MIYSFRGKTYELDPTDIEWIDKVVEWKNDELYERIADTAEIMFEKGVDEIVEKTRERYEGKLYGAALDSVAEKAKRDYLAHIKADLEAAIPEELDNYREEVLEMNYKDRLIGTERTGKTGLPWSEIFDVSDSVKGHQTTEEGLESYFEQFDSIINNSSQHHGRRLVCVRIPEVGEGEK